MNKLWLLITNNKKYIVERILVIGLVAVFGIFGIQKLYDPSTRASYMTFISGYFGLGLYTRVKIVGGIELISALLLFYKPTRGIGSLLILIQNIQILYVINFTVNGNISPLRIRDFAILMISLAILIINIPFNNKENYNN